MLKQIFILLLLIASVLAQAAYFTFITDDGAEFVVKLTSRIQIRHARNLLRGLTNRKPHIAGGIIKRRTEYNPYYSYYLHPYTIRFFDVANSLCDSDFEIVEENLDLACSNDFLPRCRLCAGRSRINREVY